MKSIRPAEENDILPIATIESLCFPKAEAASLASFRARFEQFPECFYVIELDGKVVGHINGCRYHQPALPDELFENASLHNPEGVFQTVFGLAIEPSSQRQGLARLLLDHFILEAREKKLHGVFLTCKHHLIHFYEKSGVVCLGESESAHGGAKWFDMLLTF
ncbi:GNAT family N-acetyltransferase [Vibrio salinus]|uniref:GNAT family N-acetyltransferase n=1 Tax=Vibrio salinus TaxID=2899784 RepID=UPI001E493F8C|nr:N-acetyltransferase [Vibrio salinus]MCE0492595.1 GNAT family N-acetyltransferase [Vibrio salinus]